MIAYALWEQKVRALPPSDADEERELLQIINALGNCSLLEKTFNISKSSKPLKDFLSDVHEFREKITELGDWRRALTIPEQMFHPAGATVREIRQEIEKRDEQMRSELVQFVQGQRERQDLLLADQGGDG